MTPLRISSTLGGVAALLLLSGAAAAQGLGEVLGSLQEGSGLEPVSSDQEARARDMAERAFEQAAARHVRRALEDHEGLPEETASRLRAFAAKAAERFSEDVLGELGDAKGDGLLTWAELSEEIGESRESGLDELQIGLRAIAEGVRSPPKRDEFDRTADFVWESARYILIERNPPRRWLILVACILGAMAIGRILSAALGWLAENPRIAEWGRAPASVAREPFYLVAAAAGLAVGRSSIWLPLAVDQLLRSLAGSLAALGVVWLWWRLSNSMGRGLIGWAFGEPGRARDEAVDVARKSLRLLGAFVFALVLVRIFLDADIGTLLAGVGVLGIAVSVAAQDTFRNLIASVTLHGDRPFAPGDLVRFRSHLGEIEEIGFRSTRLRALDGPLVVVPNQELVRESVENLTARSHVRHHYAIDLVYGTSPERMQEAIGIVEEILGARSFREGQEPHVSFDGYGSHSLRLALWYTSPTGDYFEARQERTEVNLEILRRFGEAGLEFAFPTRTLHVETVEAEAEEASDDDGE